MKVKPLCAIFVITAEFKTYYDFFFYLKAIVGEKVCQFKGYMQQDAQEFMAFLLDGLHEVHRKFTAFCLIVWLFFSVLLSDLRTR